MGVGLHVNTERNSCDVSTMISTWKNTQPVGQEIVNLKKKKKLQMQAGDKMRQRYNWQSEHWHPSDLDTSLWWTDALQMFDWAWQTEWVSIKTSY